MQNIKRKKDNSKDKKRIIRIFSILHFLDMEVATNPNNTNTFPNSLPLHIYKSILLFIKKLYSRICFNEIFFIVVPVA